MQETEDDEDFNTNDASTPTPVPLGTRVGWIRTAAQHQLVMAAMASYGLRLGCSSTRWKAYQVYFSNGPTSYPYHVGGACSHCFIVTSFPFCGAASPNFWAVGPCIKLGPLGTRPRVGG
jgi:hypothetical protein